MKERIIRTPDEILLENRVVLLTSEVNERSATNVVAELLALDCEDEDKPIQLIINSPGGSVIDGLSIVDTMRFIKAPVYTICIGMAASMGSVIVSAGAKGHRYIYPNARVLIHQMSGGTQGRTVDSIKEINNERKLSYNLYANLAYNAGKLTLDQLNEVRKILATVDASKEEMVIKLPKEIQTVIEKLRDVDMGYDNWLDAEVAVKEGYVDKIIESKDDIE